jgi:hypothetical protein
VIKRVIKAFSLLTFGPDRVIPLPTAGRGGEIGRTPIQMDAFPESC